MDISYRMSTPIYLTPTISPRGHYSMSWYNILLDSTISTTQYLKDNYDEVSFRVVDQFEHNGKIIRISEFVQADKVIVHSTVEMDVNNNPERFIQLIREQIMPIGEIIKSNSYNVSRKILKNDMASKEYLMTGDVEIKITEIYYDM